MHKRGQSIRAGELLSLAQNHPAMTTKIHSHLKEALREVEEMLSFHDLQTALQRGAELDLDTVVLELLTEFGG